MMNLVALITRIKHEKICVKVLLVLLIPCLMSSCTSISLASEYHDIQAKSFSPPTDKAAIYVFRDELLYFVNRFEVSINGVSLGDTGAKTYFYVELPPGDYNIVSRGENTSQVRITAEPGVNYFVWQEVKTGALQNRTLLHRVGEQRGRQGVSSSQLIRTSANMSRIQPIGSNRSNEANTRSRLLELQKLLNEELITGEEYLSKRNEILKEL